MKLYWKFVAVVPALVLVTTGCGGFSATRSISPATFLLPGLIKAEPQPIPSEGDTLPAHKPGDLVASL